MKNKTIKLVGINGRYTHSCLAIFYLRGELERRAPQLDLELCQFTINDNHFETLLRLASGEPAAILFSAVIWNSDRVERLIIDLRRMLPQTLLVVGGPQAEVVGENLPGVQLTVVKGEVEALPDTFFSGLVEGKLEDRYEVSFFKMTERDFAFPYRDEDFVGDDAPLANRHVYYESSKGCPFRCSYCLSSVETSVYHKDLQRVKEELRAILRHQPRIIRFIDRTFNDIPERVMGIWRFLKEEGGETCFHFEMAPDRFTEEMFTFLEDVPVGRFQFEIGIQSTDPQVLDAVHRITAGKAVEENISRLSAIGRVHLHLDLILGLPFSTRESFARSFRDVFAMGGHYIQMGLLKVLPDTEMARRALEYGMICTAETPYAVLRTRWLSAAELASLYWFSELVEKFMNNRCFSALWGWLRRTGEDIYLFFEQLLEICRKEGFFSLAATHELMCKQLLQLFAGRADEALLRELLLFDWLRCGHRFLPKCFGETGESPVETRNFCQRSAAEEIDGLYDRRERGRFFRKAFFVRISPQLSHILCDEYIPQQPVLCVLAENDGGLQGWNRVVLLETEGGVSYAGEVAGGV
jgi:radical SAM superfamily enzyme YgiQ (UPF0313 family)